MVLFIGAKTEICSDVRDYINKSARYLGAGSINGKAWPLSSELEIGELYYISEQILRALRGANYGKTELIENRRPAIRFGEVLIVEALLI